MTEKSFPREKFDPSRNFVVARAFLFSGRAYLAGASFDKTGIADRRLRLLYEQRYLKMADTSSAAKVSEPSAPPANTSSTKGDRNTVHTSRRRKLVTA